jgi:hypothetical protein
MKAVPQGIKSIEAAVNKIELLEGLERALDRQYERLRQSARASWKRWFAGKEPSDSCVSIRIRSADTQNRPVSSCGFLNRPKSHRPGIRIFRLARGDAK